jgi:heparan-alpha-glucosaminide N-acetyltransferase
MIMMTSPSSTVSRTAAEMKPAPGQRITAIDLLRALTMVLMIFVNDLWSLKDIPGWLEHVAPGVDGMGLADVVFPAFLFIVGMSLPFAIDNRRKKGYSEWQLVLHVLTRTLALLIMGLFLVNGETINAKAMGIPGFLWYPSCCLCFILIWNDYPGTAHRSLVYGARSLGVVALITLAVMYKGGEDGGVRLAVQWWGILGLIGWAYLASGLLTVIAKNKIPLVLVGWGFFSVLSMVSKAGLLPESKIISAIPDAVRGGTLTALSIGGVLTSLVFRHYQKKKDNTRLPLVLIAFSVVLIALSLVTRPYWKLSKLGATPAWLFLCSALTIFAFLSVYWIADVKRKAHWFNIIKPAGTNTLLCYLIPYFMYAIFAATHFRLPGVLVTGGVGLVKSVLFALLCVFITASLNKAGIKLKI